jgi:hypothetical protein
MEEGSMKRIVGLLVAALWMSAALAYDPSNRDEYLAKIKEAEAVYKEKCSTVAGLKIHKTVPDVEGILLMKIRPMRSDRELADPNWPGGAFGEEFTGDEYIMSFLGYERPVFGATITAEQRGHVNTDKRPGSRPGYRWVDVVDEKDGKRYRYTLVKKITGTLDTTAVNVRIELAKNPNMDLNIYRIVLDRQPAPDPAPRYGVTFEDHVIPEDRVLWLASSTVKAIDLKTNEVLGELTRYAISYIHQPVRSMPWLNHHVCPYAPGGSGTTTRLTVDQILIPAKEK